MKYKTYSILGQLHVNFLSYT